VRGAWAQVDMIDGSCVASLARLRDLLASVLALQRKVRSGAVSSAPLFEAEWQTLLKVRVSHCLEGKGVLHVGHGLGVLLAFCQPRQVAQPSMPHVCRGCRSTTHKKARLSKSLEWALRGW
jgi:hypothetical protein